MRQQKIRFTSAWGFAIPLTLLALLSTGCAQNIGARPFPLRISSDPTIGATAFLIPNTEWISNGMDKLKPGDPNFIQFVSRYKVTDGRTPVTTYAPSYLHVVVVYCNGVYTVARE